MNRASLDRGFGRCMLMRKHGTVLKRYPNRAADQIIAPDATKVISWLPDHRPPAFHHACQHCNLPRPMWTARAPSQSISDGRHIYPKTTPGRAHPPACLKECPDHFCR